jgi:hypothetical protein
MLLWEVRLAIPGDVDLNEEKIYRASVENAGI